MMDDPFDLDARPCGHECVYLNRRLCQLETVLLRLFGDGTGAQEWFSAAELVALNLPGLPSSQGDIAGIAAQEGWTHRRVREHRSVRRLYHVSSLPAGAFDALVARVLQSLPTQAANKGSVPPPAPQAPPPMPENTAPPWVLPLLRLLKGEAQGNLGRAWKALPAHLPRGTALPDVEEAATVLVTLGLA